MPHLSFTTTDLPTRSIRNGLGLMICGAVRQSNTRKKSKWLAARVTKGSWHTHRCHFASSLSLRGFTARVGRFNGSVVGVQEVRSLRTHHAGEIFLPGHGYGSCFLLALTTHSAIRLPAIALNVPASAKERMKRLRTDGRAGHQLRPLSVDFAVVEAADGSARLCMGDTRVIVAVYGPRQPRSMRSENPRQATFDVTVSGGSSGSGGEGGYL